jgi:enduracididine beta-hydroxylase
VIPENSAEATAGGTAFRADETLEWAQTDAGVDAFHLTTAERDEVMLAVDELTSRVPITGDDLYVRSALLATALPPRLRDFLTLFRLGRKSGIALVSANWITEETLPATPVSENAVQVCPETVRQDRLLLLLASALGDVFGWRTQQSGRIINDLYPVRGHEKMHVGSGSERGLDWHTEDAFHEFRPDFLGLLCLRNLDAVPTTVASVDALCLNDEIFDVLFEPRFAIKPDATHLQGAFEGVAAESSAAIQRVRQICTDPDPTPVLFGDRSAPFLRIDPNATDVTDGDPRAKAALEKLMTALDSAVQELTLRPGDLCLLDNFRVVHGRGSFAPRYDGGDRWLKRVNVTRDIRKSAGLRSTRDSRVI